LSDGSPLLTESQRRHFEVVLARLEESLDEVDRLSRSVAQSAPRRRLKVSADDLPPDFATRTAAASHAARDRIAELAGALGLAPQRMSPLRTVRALLHAEIVRLQDSFSGGLRGYGVLDPRAPDVIDPALRDLIALLASMVRALDAPGNASDRPAP